MRVGRVSYQDLREDGRRLSAKSHTGDAVAARAELRRLPSEKTPLLELTRGHKGGVYRPSYTYTAADAVFVSQAEHGVPFVSNSAMMRADTTHLPLLSRKRAMGTKLRRLRLEAGMTLISCSGSVGRVVYVRPELDGAWSSQDILKVNPDPELVRPGYVFAYLASRFGVALLAAGTYGAIVQHIERQHIVDLPVPRLGENVERRAHESVEEAARKRTEAVSLLKQAGDRVSAQLGFKDRIGSQARIFGTTITEASQLQSRLDATYHSSLAVRSRRLLATQPHVEMLDGAGIDVLESPRQRQVFVDPKYGAPFLTSGEIFLTRVEPNRFFSLRHLKGDPYVQEGDILVARSGQVGGIIGRGVWADSRFAGAVVSPHVLRLRPRSAAASDSGFVYAFLCCTSVGYQLLASLAAGTSIPFLDRLAVSKVLVPRSGTAVERDVGDLVRAAGVLRVEAQAAEDSALRLVETTIEGSA